MYTKLYPEKETGIQPISRPGMDGRKTKKVFSNKGYDDDTGVLRLQILTFKRYC
jgi:hypothetical protein